MEHFTRNTTLYLLRHLFGLGIEVFIVVTAFVYDVFETDSDIIFLQVSRFLGCSTIGLGAFVVFGFMDYHLKSWTRFVHGTIMMTHIS